MIRRCVLSLIAAALVFICLIAMMCPNQEARRLVPNGEVSETIKLDNIEANANCIISENGDVEITGADASIIAKDVVSGFEAVELRFGEPLDESISAQLFYDVGNGVTLEDSVHSAAFIGDASVCFDIPANAGNFFRIDIDSDYNIKDIRLYETDPDFLVTALKNPFWEYILCAIVALIAAAALFLIDYKLNFLQKTATAIIENKKNILLFIIFMLGSALLGILLELAIGLLFGGSGFNMYRCIFICGAAMSIAAVVFYARSAAKKPENLFLTLILILGSVMVFISPFGHASWDMQIHYQWALNESYIGETYMTDTDMEVINNGPIFQIKNSFDENAEQIQFANENHNDVTGVFKLRPRLSHMPSGILMALSRFFGADFYGIYLSGKLANLIVYAFACYFGMKKLKSGKMIFAVIAFLPTSLFLATTYAYDFWVTSFAMLGMAYFVSEMQQPEKQIAVKDTIIMCGAFAVACMPKEIYAPLLLIPFFLRKKEFKNRKRYYIICAMAFAALAAMLLFRSFLELSSAGDLRGGLDVSPRGQIMFILNNPLEYTKILFNFLRGYLSLSGASNYISFFAYLGNGRGADIMIVLMIATALTDKNEYDFNNKYLLINSYNIAMFFGTVVLMATALYISFTPVGLDTINGCQNRYIIPLIYPLLSMIGNKFTLNKINRNVYNTVIIAICCAVGFVTVFHTMLVRFI